MSKLSCSQEEDRLIEWFDEFCSHCSDINQKLLDSSEGAKQAQSHKQLLTKANETLKAECSVLRETVEKCHKHLELICSLEEEIRALKETVSMRDRAIEEQSTKHDKAIRELNISKDVEMETTKTDLKKSHETQVAALQEEVQKFQDLHRNAEERLQNALTEKTREINKITLEYESKLVRLQRQQTPTPQQQQSMVNHDIMRKKMNFVREQSDREIASLKAYIAELEQKQTTLDWNRAAFKHPPPPPPPPSHAGLFGGLQKQGKDDGGLPKRTRHDRPQFKTLAKRK